MILLVNGGVFLFVAAMTWTTTGLISAGTVHAFRTVAAVLAAIGLVLLVIGATVQRQSLRSELDASRMSGDWGPALHDATGGVRIDVEVVPNAKSPGFPVGFNPWRNRVQARVAAPPEEGQANDELCILVAAFFHVPRSDVEVLHGATARQKQLLVRGIDGAAARRRIEEAKA
jgi:uncharacterized protein (TIGR00251 family)